MESSNAKRAAAKAAIELVQPDSLVGLGTGSTAYFATELIGEMVKAGARISAVATSLATEVLARRLGIPLTDEFTQLDITIDGADEVDDAGNLIKGGGGALTREKIVAAASLKEVIIVDGSKLVNTLGAFPLPVEVLPFGWRFAEQQLRALGCEVSRRQKDELAFNTDNGNYILDCTFRRIEAPGELSREINAIPGVVENGLFVGLADLIIVGAADGRTRKIEILKG